MSFTGSKFLSYTPQQCDSPVLHVPQQGRESRICSSAHSVLGFCPTAATQMEFEICGVVFVFLFFFSVNICAFKTLLSFSQQIALFFFCWLY